MNISFQINNGKIICFSLCHNWNRDISGNDRRAHFSTMEDNIAYVDDLLSAVPIDIFSCKVVREEDEDAVGE